MVLYTVGSLQVRRKSWVAPSEVWILAHPPPTGDAKSSPRAATGTPILPEFRMLTVVALWFASERDRLWERLWWSQDRGLSHGSQCLQLQIESSTFQEMDDQATQVSLKLDDSTFKEPGKRRKQLWTAGMQIPSYKQGTERLVGKSTVFSKENRNEEVFKNIIIQSYSLIPLRARYFSRSWG